MRNPTPDTDVRNRNYINNHVGHVYSTQNAGENGE